MQYSNEIARAMFDRLEMQLRRRRYHVMMFQRHGEFGQPFRKIMKLSGAPSRPHTCWPEMVKEQVLDCFEGPGRDIKEFESRIGGNVFDVFDAYYVLDETSVGSVRWYWHR
jgi:hypothetical protein